MLLQSLGDKTYFLQFDLKVLTYLDFFFVKDRKVENVDKP